MTPGSLRTRLLAGALLLLCGAGLLFGALVMRQPGSVAAAAGWPLRFHVLAHSDSPADQALKLQVRDAVLPLLQELGARAGSAGELIPAVAAAVPQIEAAARRVLQAGGAPYGARAELREQEFSERRYGPLALPAGRYPALTLVLGAGAGHNWWCVMFPPMCFPEWIGRVEEDGHAAGAEVAPAAVAAALADAGSPLLLDEREIGELPVVARSALVRWLRQHGWLR